MDNAQKIWDKLISAGLTPAGAAGLMGNLYAESGLNPRPTRAKETAPGGRCSPWSSMTNSREGRT